MRWDFCWTHFEPSADTGNPRKPLNLYQKRVTELQPEKFKKKLKKGLTFLGKGYRLVNALEESTTLQRITWRV
jgi:hypothetical protein